MRKAAGFNLLELMSTVAILGILASVAASPLRDTLNRAQARSAIAQVHTAFKLARQTAVYQQQLVTLCPLDANRRCTNDWNGELTVFLDPLNARAVTQDTQIIERFPAIRHGRLQAAPAWKSYFQFTARGTSHGTLGHVRYCTQGAAVNARIVVNMSGRTRRVWDDPQHASLECP